MAFDVDEHLTQGVRAHPRAKELMSERSEVLWAGETGPLGSDRGSDAFHEFFGWRDEHPKAEFEACIEWIQSGWDEGSIPDAVDDEEIEDMLARDDEGEFDFYQEVYVLDE